MVVSGGRHGSTWQVDRSIGFWSGVGVNPDPYELTDPDTPLRFDHLFDFLLTGIAWVAVAAGIIAAVLIAWRLQSPATYELHFAVPVRRMRWRLWAYISWERLSRRCGLSASEQVTRKDREGRPVTQTRWTHPKLLQVNVSDNCLLLTVQTRMGLTVEDLERAVPAIRDAARAHAARSVVVAPVPCGWNWSCASNSRQWVTPLHPAHSPPPESHWGVAKTALRGRCPSQDATP